MDNILVKENPRIKIIDIELLKRFNYYKSILNDEIFI